MTTAAGGASGRRCVLLWLRHLVLRHGLQCLLGLLRLIWQLHLPWVRHLLSVALHLLRVVLLWLLLLLLPLLLILCHQHVCSTTVTCRLQLDCGRLPFCDLKMNETSTSHGVSEHCNSCRHHTVHRHLSGWQCHWRHVWAVLAGGAWLLQCVHGISKA